MADPRRVMHEVKQEIVGFESASPVHPNELSRPSFSDANSTTATGPKTDGLLSGKKELDGPGMASSVGVLGPFSPGEPLAVKPPTAVPQRLSTGNRSSADQACKLFWKAGDYEGASGCNSDSFSVGLDHVRVHPKFLHSNATSHKWALGAFAELLDNSLDEVCNGATYVNVDILRNQKDGNRMLLIEDNGGGMDPLKMRQCMSLGYSVKSKMANTIGQYGNGFKTSTMRLGADVIVFSRCIGKDGKRSTQSIGLLSYTFLRSTGKEDIVVPMIDYEKQGQEWNKMIRSHADDWNKNVETIVQWSPFSCETDLLQQFNFVEEHGTRIIIYNLWEDDSEKLELDFDTDEHDIQIRGVNRDEKSIRMAAQFPNSRHFLTYRHSLRSYVSILYLRLPSGFRIILRGEVIEHHNIVNDMMLTQEVTYRPQAGGDGVSKDSNMFAVVTVGFVKDARHHIDVQGFNVYHKNRLIKPFWRVWNAAGSSGRGVIGVLEANFVEPAHDKQGFERTIVLSRLEARLQQMQKTYWTSYCHSIGYAPRHDKKLSTEPGRETFLDHLPKTSSQPKRKLGESSYMTPLASQGNQEPGGEGWERIPGTVGQGHENENRDSLSEIEKIINIPKRCKKLRSSCGYELKARIKREEDDRLVILKHELDKERGRRISVETMLEQARKTIEEMEKEQECLVGIFSEERERRDMEETRLRKELGDALNTIEGLLDKDMKIFPQNI